MFLQHKCIKRWLTVYILGTSNIIGEWVEHSYEKRRGYSRKQRMNYSGGERVFGERKNNAGRECFGIAVEINK